MHATANCSRSPRSRLKGYWRALPKISERKRQRESPARVNELMSDAIQLSHPRLGLCHLVAVEGTDWIVLSISTGKRYRVPRFRRSEFVCVKQPSPPQEFINQQSPITPSEKKANPSSSPLTSPQPGSPPLQDPTQSTPEISRDGALDRRRLRKIIESLRNGLPPTDATYD